jgi:hypothetical protein
MAPLIQLAVVQSDGLGMFHDVLLKWSYVLHVRGASVKRGYEYTHDDDCNDDYIDEYDDDHDDDGMMMMAMLMMMTNLTNRDL